jgi:hypothetical protein
VSVSLPCIENALGMANACSPSITLRSQNGLEKVTVSLPEDTNRVDYLEVCTRVQEIEMRGGSHEIHI